MVSESLSPVSTIVYVEDSDDEAYVVQRHIERQHPQLRLYRFDRFDRLVDALDEGLQLDAMATMVVLDLNLTVSNGSDGIRTLRGRPGLDGMLMGVCTGSQDPTLRQIGIEAGADFFIGKPLLPGGLEAICDVVPALHWLPDSDDGFALRRAAQ